MGTAKIQDKPCDECCCNAIENGICDGSYQSVVKRTHDWFTLIKAVAEPDAVGLRAITSNSRVTTFNANRVLETIVSKAWKVCLGTRSHKIQST